MPVSFVHLHVHSEYSLADGILRVKDLVAATAAQGAPAVAVTDLANLFAAVKFYRAATAAGIKPVLGADCWVANPRSPAQPHRLVLLCQDREGYRRLNRLLTRAYLEGQAGGRPCLQPEWLAEGTGGLIALSAAQEGAVGQALLADNPDQARAAAEAYARWFPGRFYLEVQRTGHAQQEACVGASVDLAARLGLPVVATNHVHFLRESDFEIHEVRVCIQEGRTLNDARRPRRYTEQQYLRSPEEMIELFADLPEALENSVEIARRCNLAFELGQNHLPAYPVPEGQTVEALLEQEARAGLEARLPDKAGESAYRERLVREVAIINEMGFAGYFLIVADFIRWARDNDIPVGPGRGSGAGSLVAFALGITSLDPIAHKLLFERFLNPERVSLPDFDIDFCMEGRDRVIEYVASRYGRDQVAQIITHGTMAARAVVRDAGRVLDHPYGFVDKLAKLIPFEVGMTLDKALAQEEALRQRYETEDEVRELLDMARALEGIPRNVGKHAGGVVIAPSPLTDYTPLYGEPGGGQAITHLDKDDLEAIGLVKFDFLGLRTLTIIDKAVKTINARRAGRGEPPLDVERLPSDDGAAFALLKSGRSVALFQLESQGMRELIGRLEPDRFEDIEAAVALYRPGPLQSGMVEDYIKRKKGHAPIRYPHPALEAILKDTYGVILYQEQVMQIAQVLAGYSLGAADLLRRAMGKKKPEEMAKQRSIFIEGAVAHGVSERVASHIFDLMEKFAGYGFNKSHSACYALIAYQTAWLKAHYPASYMAAALSADMEHTDKVVRLIAECRDLGIEILPPDINRCGYAFEPVEEGQILYGLGAIKGIGRAAIEACLEARQADGPFQDLFDLARRVDPQRVNKRVFEALIRGGALDRLGPHRAALMAQLPVAMSLAGQESRNRDVGQDDLFGVSRPPAPPRQAEVAPWSEEERLEAERETLGLYLTGHPIERYERELEALVSARIGELKPTENRQVTVAGLVVGLRTANTRNGGRMAFLTLDDRSGRLEIAVFNDLYQACRDRLRKDAVLLVEGPVTVDEYSGGFKMSANRVLDLDEARRERARRLVVRVDAARAGNGFLNDLERVLRAHPRGRCPVWLSYENEAARADLELGPDWRVEPGQAVLDELARLAGRDGVRLDYH